MITTTTTTASHRGVGIAVFSDMFDRKMIYSCTNARRRADGTEKWFPSQGEAIANERQVIDRILGSLG